MKLPALVSDLDIFLSLQAHDLRALLRDERFGDNERLAVQFVEAVGNVPRDLQVLLLVPPDGHKIRPVQQYIRRHQHGVREQPGIDIVRVLRRFVLELSHARQFADVCVAVKDPAEFRVLVDVRLQIQHIFFRIQAARQIQRQQVVDPFAQELRILPHGERMHIGDAVHAIVLVLQFREVAQRAEVISQRQLAGRLDRAVYAFSAGVFGQLIYFSVVAHMRSIPFSTKWRCSRRFFQSVSSDWQTACRKGRKEFLIL